MESPEDAKWEGPVGNIEQETEDLVSNLVGKGF
jgi:hypothetical protein